MKYCKIIAVDAFQWNGVVSELPERVLKEVGRKNLALRTRQNGKVMLIQLIEQDVHNTQVVCYGSWVVKSDPIEVYSDYLFNREFPNWVQCANPKWN